MLGFIEKIDTQAICSNDNLMVQFNGHTNLSNKLNQLNRTQLEMINLSAITNQLFKINFCLYD